MKTKLRQLKYKIEHGVSLPSILVVISILFFCAWTWGAISSVTRNWELENRVAERQKELEILQLEVEALELENQYYASEEYQEIAARAKQNKMQDGETLVYLPKNSEEAIAKHSTTETVVISTTTEEDTRSNFEQWMSFLFGV